MTKLAYILAASHSGSTLLSMLLGSHPQIATVGEIKLSPKAIGDLDSYRCSCGKFILQCCFWQNVKEGMESRGFDFDLACAGTDYRLVDSRYARWLLSPLHRGVLLEALRDVALGLSLSWRKQLPEIHRRNLAFVSTIKEITGAKVVVDSSKIGLRLKYLLKNPDLDMKVIHLIRDGRAVALTYMDPANFADAKDPNKRVGGMGGTRENERLSMTEAAYRWRRCCQEEEHLIRRMDKSQWFRVRYEDYCRDPDGTLIRIHQFLGIVPEKLLSDFSTIEQHVIGNGMRLDATSEVSLDERWRSVLTEEELGIFDREAGRMNRRYGYE